MTKEDVIEAQGVVEEIYPNGYRVWINEMNCYVTAKPSGKVKKNKIKILEGDLVSVEVSMYDPTQARITYREKQ